jgi:hypothetical protein
LAKERLKEGKRAKMRLILHLRDLSGEEEEKSSWAHILRRRGCMRSRFEEEP